MPDQKIDWDEFASLAATAAAMELPAATRPQIVGHLSILAECMRR